MTDPNTNKSDETSEETVASPEVEAEFINPDQTPATLGNRILAALIDGVIAMLLYPVIPPLGYLAGIAYMLTRDALPFLEGQSVGKKVMKLKAVQLESGAALTGNWVTSVTRNITMVIPLMPLVELIVLSNNKDNQRLGDQWAKTKVVVVVG